MRCLSKIENGGGEIDAELMKTAQARDCCNFGLGYMFLGATDSREGKARMRRDCRAPFNSKTLNGIVPRGHPSRQQVAELRETRARARP